MNITASTAFHKEITMNITIPGKFKGGLVGRVTGADSKLLVQSNSYANFLDMSGEGNSLEIQGNVSFSASGLVAQGATAKVKTGLLDNSDALTFRSLVRVQADSEVDINSGVLGSYVDTAGTGGVGLFTRYELAGSVYNLLVRIAYAAKVKANGTKTVVSKSIYVTGKTGLASQITDTGWIYLVGKLDGVSSTGVLKIMNTGQSEAFVVAATHSALAADRGLVDTLGNPLVHMIGSAYGTNGGRRVTTAKAEVLNKLTTDTEDAAQYAADKKYLAAAFGIDVSTWR